VKLILHSPTISPERRVLTRIRCALHMAVCFPVLPSMFPAKVPCHTRGIHPLTANIKASLLQPSHITFRASNMSCASKPQNYGQRSELLHRSHISLALPHFVAICDKLNWYTLRYAQVVPLFLHGVQSALFCVAVLHSHKIVSHKATNGSPSAL
jgi:hypothetical protein